MSEAKQGEAKWTGEHTPEPWEFVEDEDAISDCFLVGVHLKDGGFSIAEVNSNDAADDAARIVACVNACAGIPDPAAHLARCAKMQEALRILVAVFPQTENMGDYDASHFVDHASSIFEAARMAREALK